MDPQGQGPAMDRATDLLLQLCGGAAGPVQEIVDGKSLPVRTPVLLRRARLALLLPVRRESFRPNIDQVVLLVLFRMNMSDVLNIAL